MVGAEEKCMVGLVKVTVLPLYIAMCLPSSAEGGGGGSRGKYVQLGSKARLQCTVSSTVQLPDYIFWYHRDHRLLDFHQPRLNISLARRGGQGSEMSVTSTLTITNARVADGGNYTCLLLTYTQPRHSFTSLRISIPKPCTRGQGELAPLHSQPGTLPFCLDKF
ncbi:hypothetical protein Pcinc_037363 [Petrolisthes cinctipes]|uniref:Ig-like domain-containing protein n=1 Tax=Petrolisthes cinctipes TaxID=88211 RepID=A0AAE1BU72_PETCI|nr:hypothetical protein Pcinc_037363 [Petrolisthes cinctipes]